MVDVICFLRRFRVKNFFLGGIFPVDLRAKDRQAVVRHFDSLRAADVTQGPVRFFGGDNLWLTL